MFLEKADKHTNSSMATTSGNQAFRLPGLSGWCARIRRLSRSMALMKTGSMSRSSWLISLEMLFSHLQRFTERFRTEMFFLVRTTPERKKTEEISSAGFLRGGTWSPPRNGWALLLLMLPWGNPTRLWNMAMARWKALPWFVPAPKFDMFKPKNEGFEDDFPF